jgi:hypothetical protein
MSDVGEDAVFWKLSDAVREKATSRMGAVCEMGVGECIYVRNPNGEVEYSNHGEGRLCVGIWIIPVSRKKEGKKWVRVEGLQEKVWIDKLTTDYENVSHLSRKAYAEKERVKEAEKMRKETEEMRKEAEEMRKEAEAIRRGMEDDEPAFDFADDNIIDDDNDDDHDDDIDDGIVDEDNNEDPIPGEGLAANEVNQRLLLHSCINQTVALHGTYMFVLTCSFTVRSVCFRTSPVNAFVRISLEILLEHSYSS